MYVCKCFHKYLCKCTYTDFLPPLSYCCSDLNFQKHKWCKENLAMLPPKCIYTLCSDFSFPFPASLQNFSNTKNYLPPEMKSFFTPGKVCMVWKFWIWCYLWLWVWIFQGVWGFSFLVWWFWVGWFFCLVGFGMSFVCYFLHFFVYCFLLLFFYYYYCKCCWVLFVLPVVFWLLLLCLWLFLRKQNVVNKTLQEIVCPKDLYTKKVSKQVEICR